MLTRGVLNVILSTIITLSLRNTSKSTIIVGVLGELIIRSTRIVIIKGVKALNKGGAVRERVGDVERVLNLNYILINYYPYNFKL
jgi:hypothetical protein